MSIINTNKQEPVEMRRMAFQIIKLSTRYSLTAIGSAFGYAGCNRDHSAVLFSLRAHRNLYDVDKNHIEIFDKMLKYLDS